MNLRSRTVHSRIFIAKAVSAIGIAVAIGSPAFAAPGDSTEMFDARLADGLEADDAAAILSASMQKNGGQPTCGSVPTWPQIPNDSRSASRLSSYYTPLGAACWYINLASGNNWPTECAFGCDDHQGFGDLGDGSNHTANPIDLPYGDKFEAATDLNVRVTGADYKITRSYTSNPGYSGAGLVGESWTLTPFVFIETEYVSGAEDDLLIVWPRMREVRYVYDATDVKWYPSGASDSYIIESDLTIGSDKYATWRLVRPGRDTIDFYREHDASGGFTETPSTHERLRLMDMDLYGNQKLYTYYVFGTSLNDPAKEFARLTKVTCTNAESTPVDEAEIDFEWETGASEPDKGRLLSITVSRPDGAGTTETQRVEYTYKANGDGNSSGLGTENDLIQVEQYTRVDNSTSSYSTWRLQVSQYRYHGLLNEITDTDGDGIIEKGAVHQLKAAILPQQLEYFAQALADDDSGTTYNSVLDGATHLLTLDDGDDWFTGAGQIVMDLGSKVVSKYETSGENRVKEQYLQTACGCGGSTQDLRFAYDYYSYASGSVSDTVKITENYWDGTDWDSVHRIRYYDLGSPEAGAPPYMISSVINDGSKNWVNHFEYNAAERTIKRKVTPSAVSSYTPGTSSTAPSITVSTTSGLVYAYEYSSSGPYIIREGVRKGNDSSFSNFDKLSEVTRDSTRPWLITKHEGFRVAGSTAVDNIETSNFSYKFYSGSDAVASISSDVEAELVSENGPGGGAVYTTYMLFNDLGNHEWIRLADNTLAKKTYDDGVTGEPVSEERNHDGTGLPATWTGGQSTSGWGESGDSLKVVYEVDLLGRRTKTKDMPNGNGPVTYTMRAMRELPEKPYVEHYTEITLPHIISGSGTTGSYGSHASVRWIDADNEILRGSTYQPTAGVSGYDLTDDDAVIDWGTGDGDDWSRVYYEVNVSDQVLYEKVWYDIPNNKAYTKDFEYDEMGRVKWKKDPNGTYTQYTYDALDRRIKSEIGTDVTPTTGDMVTVSETFFDSGGTTTQGVGNGVVTLTRHHEDGSNYRDIERTYDWRDRLITVENPIAPYSYYEYDNLNRRTKHAIFKSVPTAIDTPLADRGKLTRMFYSQRGMVYMTDNAITPSLAEAAGGFGTLESNSWFDEMGRTIEQWGASAPATKTVYDFAGRVDKTYVVDRRGDPDPGATSNHDHADDVTGDVVLSQSELSYITDTPLVELTTQYQRAHDAADTDTGALSGLASAKSIITYGGMFYDAADRPISMANFGTNQTGFKHGGSAPTISQSTPLEWDSGGDQIVSEMIYDERGRVEKTIDPTGIETLIYYDDMDRRIAVVGNYIDATVSWDATDVRWEPSGITDTAQDEDRVTSYVHDGNSNVIKQVAFIPTGVDIFYPQETEFIYDTTDAAALASDISSKSLLALVHYPDETNGNANTAAAYTVKYAYNRLGEKTDQKDQNGTVHEYSHDDLGRVTKDDVTTFGTGIDQWADAIETTYDTLGRRSKVTTKDDTTVLNEVEYSYTDLWQVDEIWQDVNSAINKTSGDSMSVDYDYDDAKMASGNWSRIDSVTYPDGSDIFYDYGTTGDSDDVISRNTSVIGDSNTLVAYEHIGVGMYAIAHYEDEPEVKLDYTVAANGARTAGEYPGFDRYGRVILHSWVDDVLTTHPFNQNIPNKPQLVSLGYQYNKAGDRLVREDARIGARRSYRDDQYLYDDLHRLIENHRGVLSGSTVAQDVGSRDWDLDSLGNWELIAVDLNGDDDYTDTDEKDTREHNLANELERRTINAATSYDLDYTSDDSGSLETEEYASGDFNYTHDAWNRLVRVHEPTTPTTIDRGRYEYNGLNWRTVTKATPPPFSGVMTDVRMLFYDKDWRMIQEIIDDNAGAIELDEHGQEITNSPDDRMAQQIWGLRYIDDAVMRRESSDRSNDSSGTTWEDKWYYCSDVMFSTVAVIDDAAKLVERVRYTPYGQARHSWKDDVDGDGDSDSTDQSLITSAINKLMGGSGYNVDADINRSGLVTAADSALYSAKSALAAGFISEYGATNPDSTVGFDGYVFNVEGMNYTARPRSYAPEMGRWIERNSLIVSSPYEFNSSKPLLRTESEDVRRLGPSQIEGTPDSNRSEFSCSILHPNDNTACENCCESQGNDNNRDCSRGPTTDFSECMRSLGSDFWDCFWRWRRALEWCDTSTKNWKKRCKRFCGGDDTVIPPFPWE